ncbi:MAG: M48 family metalloprotease [Candidatus Marinimicrobia bacterium]|nr:M48 family metalloprotease [Candidatus Neomarinimicrobiota bacterium]MCF7828117.1 M48 family metalloprotease [Candidatus Neomarinimicrobiota bacterium]MCF7879708.1 M48 family metalloprotease [Candidatus Neomarinimicrobiota bacterium]
MDKLFTYLGRKAGRTYVKGKWIFQSVFGSEEEGVAAENDLGKALAKDLESQEALIRDSTLEGEVNGIGKELTACVTAPDRTFRFRITESKEVNAFALPGGFIYFTSGLLELPGISNHEVAFVMGHEVGHVIRGHPFDKLLANTSMGFLKKIMGATTPAGGLTQKAIGALLRSDYSQEQELEADWFAVRLMAAAGYDVQAAIDMLHRFQALRGESGTALSYFASHPSPDERVRHLSHRLGK